MQEESSERLPGPSKKCNCRNSKCIKLYCECYQANVFCDSSCHCQHCFNNPSNDRFRKRAMQNTLEKNPSAFQPKILTSDSKPDPLNLGKHNKGCACRKSGCMKKYCECFQAKVPCSDICKCCECRNHGYLTREHFLRATHQENENLLYQLLLAKDQDHLQSLLTLQNKRVQLEVPDIEEMCGQMKSAIKMKKELDEVDYICQENSEEDQQLQQNQKIQIILDIFIATLRTLE